MLTDVVLLFEGVGEGNKVLGLYANEAALVGFDLSLTNRRTLIVLPPQHLSETCTPHAVPAP